MTKVHRARPMMDAAPTPAGTVTNWQQVNHLGYQIGVRVISDGLGKTEVQRIMRPDPSTFRPRPWWVHWVCLPGFRTAPEGRPNYGP